MMTLLMSLFLRFLETQGVEHETNDVDRDDRKELLGSQVGSVRIPMWSRRIELRHEER
jgi:hypothetical protein